MTRCAICDEPLPPRWKSNDCPKCTKVVVQTLEAWAIEDLEKEVKKEGEKKENVMSWNNRKLSSYAYQQVNKYLEDLPLDNP